jgi:hypothetical protein
MNAMASSRAWPFPRAFYTLRQAVQSRGGPDQAARHLPGRVGKHIAEMQSQGADRLQAVPLSSAQLGRAVLNKIKDCRRVATRYDKLAAKYLAFVKLACIRLWLRVDEFTTW